MLEFKEGFIGPRTSSIEEETALQKTKRKKLYDIYVAVTTKFLKGKQVIQESEENTLGDRFILS